LWQEAPSRFRPQPPLFSLQGHNSLITARRTHDEAAAGINLNKAMRILGLNEESLTELPKGSPEKAVLAWWLRENTTVTLRWVSHRLQMGHYTRVTQAISRVARRPNRKQKHLKQKLKWLTQKCQEKS
jgi:hypothetical protein